MSCRSERFSPAGSVPVWAIAGRDGRRHENKIEETAGSAACNRRKTLREQGRTDMDVGLIKYGRVTILNGMQKAVAQLSPALTSILAVCQKTDDRQRMKTHPESGGCKAQHAKHPRNLRRAFRPEAVRFPAPFG